MAHFENFWGCLQVFVLWGLAGMYSRWSQETKNKIPDDATKTMDLYSLVSVATEAKYDLTTDIDVTDGLTNGAVYGREHRLQSW